MYPVERTAPCKFLAAVNKFVETHSPGDDITPVSLISLNAQGLLEKSSRGGTTMRKIRCAGVCSGTLAMELEHDQLVQMGWTGQCVVEIALAQEAQAALQELPPEPTSSS